MGCCSSTLGCSGCGRTAIDPATCGESARNFRKNRVWAGWVASCPVAAFSTPVLPFNEMFTGALQHVDRMVLKVFRVASTRSLSLWCDAEFQLPAAICQRTRNQSVPASACVSGFRLSSFLLILTATKASMNGATGRILSPCLKSGGLSGAGERH